MVEAAKLQSHNKLLESYGSLIDAYYDSKKFADAARVCKELLDLKTDDGKPRIVLRAYTEATAKPTSSRMMPSTRPNGSAQRAAYLCSGPGQARKYDQALKLVDDLLKDKQTTGSNLQLKGRILHEAGPLRGGRQGL